MILYILACWPNSKAPVRSRNSLPRSCDSVTPCPVFQVSVSPLRLDLNDWFQFLAVA
jgi:hypothetical protein